MANSLELTTLRHTTRRKFHTRYMQILRKDAIDSMTLAVLNDQAAFFEENPSINVIKYDEFYPFFKLRHPALSGDKLTPWTHLLKQLDQPLDPELEAGLADRILAEISANDVLSLVEKYKAGEDIDFTSALKDIVDQFDSERIKKVKVPEVLTDVEDMLDEEDHNIGITFRLDELNANIVPLRGGDFVIVAARPDTGKTTFIASELTEMAKHIATAWADEPNRPCVWFNNEGDGMQIKKRVMQASGGYLPSQMKELAKLPSTQGNRSQLQDEFIKETDGGWARIKIMDVHDFWHHEIERIIQETKPAIVVFDMIDNIKFGGLGGNNGQRTDQLLEAMYQWARMTAVKYDFVAIATSQVSGDGDGLQYPTLNMLKDSKTGKQGAADIIITIGFDNNPNHEGVRWIGCTKNKRVREGGQKSPRAEVQFHAMRGRFESYEKEAPAL